MFYFHVYSVSSTIDLPLHPCSFITIFPLLQPHKSNFYMLFRPTDSILIECSIFSIPAFRNNPLSSFLSQGSLGGIVGQFVKLSVLLLDFSESPEVANTAPPATALPQNNQLIPSIMADIAKANKPRGSISVIGFNG